MTNRWVYAGVLDDSHLRYDQIARSQGTNFFYNQLLKQVFFGDPILLNDGYVFSNSGLDHLLDPKSLLRYLLSAGFVRVLTRSAELDPESFSEIPERQATAGQTTAKMLVARRDFPEIKKAIKDFAIIASNGRIERFPNRKMHEGFHKLMSRVSEKSVEDLGIFGMTTGMWQDFIKNAESIDSYYAYPRDTIEKHAVKMYEQKTLSWSAVESIMAVANQAYHYNFALCLSNDKGFPVSADTTIGLAFEDLLDFDQSFEVDPNDWRDAPRINIPKNFPKNEFKLVGDFVTPGTEAYEAKMSFLENTSAVISSGKTDRRADLDQIFKEYQSRIAENFAENGYRTPVRFLGDVATGSAIGIGISEINGAVGLIHDLAPVAGAAIGAWGKYPDIKEIPVIGLIVQHTKRVSRDVNRKLVEMSMNVKTAADPDRKRQISVYSGVAFNKSAARAHVSHIPKFS